VDQGWGPLCDFLGVPQPATPFPNVNDRAEIKKEIRTIMTASYVMLGLSAAAIAAAAYALVHWVF